MSIADELIKQRDAVLFGTHVNGHPFKGEACLVHQGNHVETPGAGIEGPLHHGTGCGCMSREAYDLVSEAAQDWVRDNISEAVRYHGPEAINDSFLDKDLALEILDTAIRVAKELP